MCVLMLLKGKKISEKLPHREVFELVITNKYIGLKEGNFSLHKLLCQMGDWRCNILGLIICIRTG